MWWVYVFMHLCKMVVEIIGFKRDFTSHYRLYSSSIGFNQNRFIRSRFFNAHRRTGGSNSFNRRFSALRTQHARVSLFIGVWFIWLHVLIYHGPFGWQGRIKWHCVTEGMGRMTVLRSISEVVSFREYVRAKCSDVDAGYTRRSAVSTRYELNVAQAHCRAYSGGTSVAWVVHYTKRYFTAITRSLAMPNIRCDESYWL
jgi:hypothetical protein